MRRALLPAFLLLLLTPIGRAVAQDDPVLGNWRGTVTSSQGMESPIIITIVRKGEKYEGSTTGLAETSEVPLTRVEVSGTRVAIVASADSKLGSVGMAGDLVVEGNSLKGGGTLTVGAQRFDISLQLTRRSRRDVIQPQVEQRVEYFIGRWKFEYLGGEFPPLSTGSRTGAVTFSKAGASSFVTGQVEGEVLGKPYRETISIGFDKDSGMLAFLERRADGVELMSLASWRSPLAIVFQTSPVQAGSRSYQLRRVISVFSDAAFDLTEEFSIDGGPYRRLGTAHYTKLP